MDNLTYVSPSLNDTKHCFVFSANDAYAPYLGVALHSFLEHASENTQYDICILYTNISLKNRQKILHLQQKNVTIRFFDISYSINMLDTSIFKTHAHFSIEAYYRFFIPEIFKNYEKVVYFDCDLIFNDNIDDIVRISFDDKYVCAVMEYKFKCKVAFDAVLRQYAIEILKLKNVQKYFNSGFIIFNINALKTIEFTKVCLENLVKIGRPRTVDQCVLNSILQDNVKLLDAKFNFQTHVDVKELKKYVSLEDYVGYVEALLAPKVIHYCSPVKPWNNMQVPFSDLWWKYAKNSDFYDDIIHINGHVEPQNTV